MASNAVQADLVGSRAAGQGTAPQGPPKIPALRKKVHVDTRAIDGMRGVAVIHIVMGHSMMWSRTKEFFFSFRLPNVLHDECSLGFVALMGGGSMGLFYIISGFVMAVGYAQTLQRYPSQGLLGEACDNLCCCCCKWCIDLPLRPEEGLASMEAWDFMFKRCARLGPMYYLTNLVSVFLLPMSTQLAAVLYSCGQIVATSLFMTSWIAGGSPPNGATWTVSTLMFFYMCFPALAPRLQRVHPSRLRCYGVGMFFLQAALLGLPISIPILGGTPEAALGVGQPIRAFPPSRLPVFIMGICAGLQRVHAEQAREAGEAEEEQGGCCSCAFTKSLSGCLCLAPANGLCLFWLTSSALCTALTFACEDYMFLRLFLEILFPMLFYDLVVAATDPAQKDALVTRIFASRVLSWLGDISMCVYMVHLPVILALQSALGWDFFQMDVWAPGPVLVVSLGLGWLLTRYFEKPMAKLLRPAPDGTVPREAQLATPGASSRGSPATSVAAGELVGSPVALLGARG